MKKIMNINVLEELEDYDWNKVVAIPKNDSSISTPLLIIIHAQSILLTDRRKPIV